MKPSYLIGIDCGTTGVRAGIFDFHGRMIAQSECRFELTIPKVGWAEQDPMVWLGGLTGAVRGSVEQLPRSDRNFSGIGLTATSASVVAVGHEGRVLRDAIMWMDVRSQPQTERIVECAPEGYLDKVGGRINAEWFTPKVLWLKDNEPDVYRSAERMVDAVDWLTYFLTGNWVGSMSNATNSGAYFLSQGGWHLELLRRIGLGDLQTKLVDRVDFIGKRAGNLTPSRAETLGLPEGTPVGIGGIDCHIGTIGVNALQQGQMALIIGTSTCHLALCNEPHYIPAIWGPFEGAILPDMWLIETGQTSTGSILEWFRSQFASKGESIAELSKEAEAVEMGSENLTMLDTWQGNRSPYNESFTRGAFVGLSLRHTRAHILRAVFEGICFGAATAINHTEKHSGISIDQLKIAGGGTANRFWMQMHADITGREVTLTSEPEAMLLGAAISGGVAAGVFADLREGAGQMVQDRLTLRPRGEVHERSKALSRRYQEVYGVLRPIFREIAES
jgi:FGGY-family pentulose kinase